MKLSQIKENPNNPRTIDKRRFELLKKSIKDFPQMLALRPIVVDENGMSIGGNMRTRALRALGYKEIPDEWVKKASELTEEQKREFIVKDNAGFGEWDWDLLANEWSDLPLSEWGVDVPEDWVASEPVQEDESAVAEMVDKAAELQKKWKVKRGQIWEIGKHRLMCGDSTEKEDIQQLMSGAKAHLIFTDPPYGVSYEGKTADALTIQNDGDASCAVKAMRLAVQFLEDGCPCYMCFPAEELSALAQIWQSPLRLQSQLIWAKDSMVMGRKDYHYQHEPIWYGWREGASHRWYVGRDQVTLWQVDRPSVNAEHPTMKPPELAERAIENSSMKGDIVLDVFGGSGSTMSAAERLNRIAYLNELEPNYAAVTLERLSSLGLKPKLIN